MELIKVKGEPHGIDNVCRYLGFPRSTYYRHMVSPKTEKIKKERPKPANALSEKEKKDVIEILNSEKYVDETPYVVYTRLLDKGIYKCSIRTMYRLLGIYGEVFERRNQLKHPEYKKPELLATIPNQVWSWDITKLKGPVKWTYYQLYVIMDIFSRFIVGWLIADRECSTLAKQLIKTTCINEKINKDQLIIHSDRGTSMTSKTVEQLLGDLNVQRSLNRPHVSNDNPYSEAHFKTFKYRPEFPKRFGSIQDARQHCKIFFDWYNYKHLHSGIAYMTPAMVHQEVAQQVYDSRAKVLLEASLKYPERFKGKISKPPQLQKEVWINKPDKKGEIVH